MPDSETAAKQFRQLAQQIDEPESAARMIAQAEKIERRAEAKHAEAFLTQPKGRAA